jgi:hypothetical protein
VKRGQPFNIAILESASISFHKPRAVARNEPSSRPVGALLTGSLAVDAVFLPAELSDRDSLLRQREDHAGRGDAAQYVLAKRDQRRCGLGSDRA